MVASRNQMHTLAREIGSAPNGSMPPYAAVGEMNARMNPTSWNKHRKVTALGEQEGIMGLGLIDDLPTPTVGVALGVGLMYFGLDMPYAKEVKNVVKDAWNNKYETVQYASLLVGMGAIVAYAYRS